MLDQGRFANSSEERSDIFWGTEVLLYLGGSQTYKGTHRIQVNQHFLLNLLLFIWDFFQIVS